MGEGVNEQGWPWIENHWNWMMGSWEVTILLFAFPHMFELVYLFNLNFFNWFEREKNISASTLIGCLLHIPTGDWAWNPGMSPDQESNLDLLVPRLTLNHWAPLRVFKRLPFPSVGWLQVQKAKLRSVKMFSVLDHLPKYCLLVLLFAGWSLFSVSSSFEAKAQACLCGL